MALRNVRRLQALVPRVPTTSMIIAAGVVPTLGGLQIPVHFAVALAKGGPRLTTFVGWKIH